MSKIIPLKTKKQKALELFAERLVAHLASLFYRHGVMHIPVQGIVKSTIDAMLSDGFDYWPETLDYLGTDADALQRIEDMFVATMIEQGVLEKDFR